MGKKRPYFINRILRPIEQFTRTESSSGFLLLLMTFTALVIANTGISEEYFQFFESPFTIGIGDLSITRSLLHWISDGLMAIFFFLVGLEVKREFISGELSDRKNAALPIFGAFGGMVVPAIIFTLFNAGTSNSHGWGIPMATDIAFALGIVTLLGKRVPFSLKVFLVSLAVIDDIGAVIVIAVFYTGQLNFFALLVGFGLLGVLLLGNAVGIRSRSFYALIGMGVWLAFLQSGIHATVAGVLVAFTVPARARRGSEQVQTTLSRFEQSLHGIVAYCILPVFVFANAGVQLEGDLAGLLSSKLGLGIMLGLVLGKPFGIAIFCYLSAKAGLAKLPNSTSWRQLVSIGFLGGIGFTMSLFITGLAFADPSQIAEAKRSILLASVCASLLGWIAFSIGNPQKQVRQ